LIASLVVFTWVAVGVKPAWAECLALSQFDVECIIGQPDKIQVDTKAWVAVDSNNRRPEVWSLYSNGVIRDARTLTLHSNSQTDCGAGVLDCPDGGAREEWVKRWEVRNSVQNISEGTLPGSSLRRTNPG